MLRGKASAMVLQKLFLLQINLEHSTNQFSNNMKIKMKLIFHTSKEKFFGSGLPCVDSASALCCSTNINAFQSYRFCSVLTNHALKLGVP